jgi:O-methyltransferase involved in polyketide biosynthesis
LERGILVRFKGGPVAAGELPARDRTRGLETPGACDPPLAEGLLMYLPESRVRSILRQLATATDGPSRLVFSFMVEREGGEIGFEPRSAMVTYWLAMKREPFRWSMSPARSATFAREVGWSVQDRADASVLLSLAGSTDRKRMIAHGEEIIEASQIESHD